MVSISGLDRDRNHISRSCHRSARFWRLAQTSTDPRHSGRSTTWPVPDVPWSRLAVSIEIAIIYRALATGQQDFGGWPRPAQTRVTQEGVRLGRFRMFHGLD